MHPQDSSDTTTPRPAATADPRALGSRYRLVHPLGGGAMGQVWAADDLRTGERVAAKLLRPELVADQAIVARFVQERSILLSLRHPHVVRVRDLVVEGDDLALVMDVVDGPDLRAYLIERGTLPPAEAVRIVSDVLDALAAAHDHGVLHRDVKPDNVLLDRSEPPFVHLTDFGIARLAQQTTVTMTGVLGTAAYIAPEIFLAEAVSPASDIYACGVVLYELLAGRSPFEGSGAGAQYAVAHRHVTAEPPPLAGLPDALAGALAVMLDKDPDRRPGAASAAAELRALLPALRGLAALPPQASPAAFTTSDTGDADIRVAGAQTRAPGDIDPRRTAIRGRPKVTPAAGGPLPGQAVPVVPAAPPVEDDPTGTRIHPAPRPARAPLDVPDAPDAPTTRGGRRRRLLVAATIAVVALAGVGIGLGVSSGGSGDKSPAPAPRPTSSVRAVPTAQSSLDQDPTASGLVTVESASLYAATAKLVVSLRFTSNDAHLQGPFLEGLPAPGGGPGVCARPVPVGSTPAPRLVDAQDCGFSVTAPPITPHRPATARFALTVTSEPGSAPFSVARYLSRAATATRAALVAVGDAPTFVAQRLTGLVVQSPRVLHVGHPLTATVRPRWIGHPPGSSATTLYSYGRGPTVLANRTVTGRVSRAPVRLSLVPGRDSGDTQCQLTGTSQQSGLYLVGGSVAAGVGTCTLRATLGDVQGATSVSVSLNRE